LDTLGLADFLLESQLCRHGVEHPRLVGPRAIPRLALDSLRDLDQPLRHWDAFVLEEEMVEAAGIEPASE